MSYSGDLGAVLPTQQLSRELRPSPRITAPTRTRTPLPQVAREQARAVLSAIAIAKRDPFFPPTCAHLKAYVAPPATIPANTVVVKSWPFTKASASQVSKMLDYLVKGVPSLKRRVQVGGRTIVENFREFPEAINRVWMTGLNVHGAAGFQRPTPASLMRVLSAGWITDPESSPSVTRGTFWIALSMGVPMSKGWFDQQLRSFKRAAMVYAGISDRVVQNKLMANVSGMAIAGRSDTMTPDVLKAGAYKSALSSGEFAAFVRTTFAMPYISKSSREIAKPIEARSKLVIDATAALGQVENIVSGVGAVIGQARTLPDPAAGVQMLVAVRSEVETVKATINGGANAASGVLQEGERIRSATMGQMRRAILASAEASIARGIGFSIARDYVRCWTLSQARKSLGRQFDSLLSVLMAGVNAAAWLVQAAPQVRRANGILDDLIERLKKEERELPLSPWLRTTLGVPHWGWATLGGVALLGGAFGIRRMRKKGKMKKNRRPRRRLTA